MMRKDVKLGLAIGGVLLAVLVVYVLVGTGGGDRNTANNTPAGIALEDTSGKVPADGSKIASAGSDTGANSPAVKPPAGNALPPGTPTDSVASNHPSSADTAAKAANDALWGDALNKGQLMLTQTPDTNSRPAPQTGDTPGGGNPQPPAEPVRANAPADVHGRPDADDHTTSTDPSTVAPTGTAPRATDSSAIDNTTTPNGSSASGASRPRTHVVQKGETLASIAQMAYGSANYFPAIQRANPNIDPKKLKPGMTITLPAISEVKPDAGANAEPASARANGLTGGGRGTSSIDPKTQYRVESGDTLERIAMKLYGKRDMIQKIQDANKDQLPDANKLKLNMILKLPEPPTKS